MLWVDFIGKCCQVVGAMRTSEGDYPERLGQLVCQVLLLKDFIYLFIFGIEFQFLECLIWMEDAH